MKKEFLKVLIVMLCFFGCITIANAQKDYDVILEKLAPKGIIEIKGVEPPTNLPAAEGSRPQDIINMLMELLIKEQASSLGLDIEESYNESISVECTTSTDCIVNIITREQHIEEDGTPSLGVEEIAASKKVEIKYTNPNSFLIQDAKQLMNKIKKGEKFDVNNDYHYIADGLTVLNYDYNLYKNGYIMDFARLHYISEINDLLEGRNYQIRFIGPSGNSPWANYGNGYSVIYYKNMPLAYGGVTNITLRKILYIPSDTPNTSEDYIKAAKKIIDDYIPNNKLTVRLVTKEELQGETVDNILKEFHMDKKDTDGNVYILEDDGHFISWYILAKETKDKKKSKPEFNKKDYDSKVNVKSSDGSISLDSKLQVEIIENGTKEYQKIENSINKEDFQAFDINLYSDGLAKSIKVLESGTFEVSLPVEDALKNKNLIVYYIKDDGKIEKHPVTIDKEGNAVFETNHFSTYILSEDETETTNETEVNPQTGDKILTFIGMSILSVGLLILGMKNLKRV